MYNLRRFQKESQQQTQVKIKTDAEGNVKRRVRATYGGDRSDYEGERSTQPATIATVKLHLNSTISTPDAQYVTMDIKDYYLGTPMSHKEWMWADLKQLPAESIKKYNLEELASKGKNRRVLIRIDKAIYGLPQAGRLAQQQLDKHLEQYGYIRHRNPVPLHT